MTSPVARAAGELADQPLDEKLKWSVNLHGDKSEVTVLPELVLDDKDKQTGATSLATQTAGKGNRYLWLDFNTKFNPPINLADYESLSVSYKFAPKVLEAPEKATHQIKLVMSNPQVAGEELAAWKNIVPDGQWHTLEVPISEFKQQASHAAVKAFSGESVSFLSLAFGYTAFEGAKFDVATHIDNIVLKLKK